MALYNRDDARDGAESRSVPAFPGTDARFRQAALDIALLSDGVLASHDAPMLALAVPSDGWGGAAPMLLWDQRLAPRADRVRDLFTADLFAPALDALCLAADDLFACLRRADACPADTRGLCVITDGVGLALTADTPDPDTAGTGWLLALAAGRAVTILPLATDGLWSLLRAETMSCAIH